MKDLLATTIARQTKQADDVNPPTAAPGMSGMPDNQQGAQMVLARQRTTLQSKTFLVPPCRRVLHLQTLTPATTTKTTEQLRLLRPGKTRGREEHSVATFSS